MIEWLVVFLQDLPIWGLLAFTFLIAFIEHIFPPSPSDLVLVFVGTIVGIGVLDFTTTLVVASAGSLVGFGAAYWIGRWYGLNLIEKGWVPFITTSLVERVERWFDKYHGLIIVANRFLAGTRAVIAFVAGITKMKFPRTLTYSALSATAWNALLLWIGMQVGSRWKEVDSYLSAYGWAVTCLMVVALIIFVVVDRKRKRAKQNKTHIAP